MNQHRYWRNFAIGAIVLSIIIVGDQDLKTLHSFPAVAIGKVVGAMITAALIAWIIEVKDVRRVRGDSDQ